jgi:N6-L-threonylcarbamoyladenine synthase
MLLGIETSCDETSVALLEEQEGRPVVRKMEIASQLDVHRPYGGVVPELATRQHLKHLPEMVDRLVTDSREVEAIAVTAGPGLASSLLIGLSYAKGLSYSTGSRLIPVNHMEGHIYSPFLTEGQWPVFPHLGLIVSGGHTMLVLAREAGAYEIVGSTRDDAAGEAFDKSAKCLGLPYPGGPEIEKLASEGNPEAHHFPRSMIHSGDFHFSFSGLKTSLRVQLQNIRPEGRALADLCASFQQAIIDVLVEKARRAISETGVEHVTLSGGVSNNGTLREAFLGMVNEAGCRGWAARSPYTGDNAAMIAAAGWKKVNTSSGGYACDIQPGWRLDNGINQK